MLKLMHNFMWGALLCILPACAADTQRIQIVHGVAQLGREPIYRMNDHILMFERLVHVVTGQSAHLYYAIKQNPDEWLVLLKQKSGLNVAVDELLIPVHVSSDNPIKLPLGLPYSFFEHAKNGEAICFRVANGTCLVRLVLAQEGGDFHTLLASRIALFLHQERVHKEGIKWLEAESKPVDWAQKISDVRRALGEEAAKKYEEDLRNIGKII